MEARGFDLEADATWLMLVKGAVATSAIEGEVMSRSSARSASTSKHPMRAAFPPRWSASRAGSTALATEDLLFRAAIAHLWILTIHPFEDGNGRIARAIVDVVLSRSYGGPARLYSMSTQIEAERSAYYEELESQQRASLDVTRWLGWFLGCLERSFGSASAQLAEVGRHQSVWMRAHGEPEASGLSEGPVRVLQRVLRGFDGPMTTSKYAAIAKCSQDSALRDLSDLVKRAVHAKSPGGGRSTSDRLTE